MNHADSPHGTAASPRVPELDGVRGVAALAIMLWHYGPTIGDRQPGTIFSYADRLLSLCWSGVDLFFVLSGFLIGSILLRESGSPHYFATFYVRRAARIVPLYAILMAALAVGTWWQHSGAPELVRPLFENTLPWWSYPLFAQNLFMPGVDDFGPKLTSVTWSLAVEEQFYLVLPLLIFVVPRRALGWVLLALGAAAPALRAQIPAGMSTYVLLPCRLDSLMAGVLLALVWCTPQWRTRLERAWPVLAAIWLILALYAITVVKRGAGLWELRLSYGWFVNTWVACWFALTLALVLAGPRWFGAVFRWRPLRQAGLVAYGLYLLHGPVLHLCHYLILGQQPVLNSSRTAGVTALAAVLSLLAASATYRWIETPFLELGRRFRYGAAPAGAASRPA